MPPKKRPKYGISAAAERIRAIRASETEEERNERLQAAAERSAERRQQETAEEQELRLQALSQRVAIRKTARKC